MMKMEPTSDGPASSLLDDGSTAHILTVRSWPQLSILRSSAKHNPVSIPLCARMRMSCRRCGKSWIRISNMRGFGGWTTASYE